MQTIRVLVVDDNVELIGMIKEYFNNHAIIKIVNAAYDGEQGIEIIKNHQDEFDLILLDLIMPKKDGLCVLEFMRKENIQKRIVVLTSYNAQDMIRRVTEYGVDYFILKPFELIDLQKRIEECCSPKKLENKNIDINQNNLQLSITKILHELGIPSHIKGYQYIREGIITLYENQEMIGGITKMLYPELAKQFDTTTSRVERAIRHAIEVSWNRGDWDLMEEIFGNSVDIDRAKPTNSEFIVTIADKLRLDNQKVR